MTMQSRRFWTVVAVFVAFIAIGAIVFISLFKRKNTDSPISTPQNGSSFLEDPGTKAGSPRESTPEKKWDSKVVRIKGRVVDRHTGVGIPDALVTILAKRVFSEETFRYTSDERGEFISEDILGWGASIDAKREGYTSNIENGRTFSFGDPSVENYYAPSADTPIIIYMTSVKTMLKFHDVQRSEFTFERAYTDGEQRVGISISDAGAVSGSDFLITLTPVTGKEDLRGLRIRIEAAKGGVWSSDKAYSDRPMEAIYKRTLDKTPSQSLERLQTSWLADVYMESIDKKTHAVLQVHWNSDPMRNFLRVRCRIIP